MEQRSTKRQKTTPATSQEDILLQHIHLLLQNHTYFKPTDTIGLIVANNSFFPKTVLTSIQSQLNLHHNISASQKSNQYDACLCLGNATKSNRQQLEHTVRRGGLILLIVPTLQKNSVASQFLNSTTAAGNNTDTVSRSSDWNSVNMNNIYNANYYAAGEKYTIFCFRHNTLCIVNNRSMGPVVLDRQLNLDTTSTTTTTTTAAAATTTSATTCTTNNNTEINNLNKITVSLNLQERLNGSIDSISHRQIIQVMQEHGVCVIEGLFKKTSNDIKKKWGQGVKKDMDDIIQALQTNHNINLMDHKQADKLASNFVEISTREYLRFDVRLGTRLNVLNENADNVNDTTAIQQKEKEDQQDSSSSSSSSAAPTRTTLSSSSSSFSTAPTTTSNSTTSTTSTTTTPTKTTTTINQSKELSRRHPSILNIVKDLFNPTSNHKDGNWGKYNFQGGGIGSVPEPIVSPIGCVVSDPGARAQQIHADTPHLFENIHMNPHYINCFLPIVDNHQDLSVGQTGFFIGTHVLKTSADVVRSIQSSDGQNVSKLKSRLVRPHLRTGDCLLFDTRTFHFGLPNDSQNTRRCILYINFTQHWFARQRTDKNWGKVSCFEKEKEIQKK